MTEQKMSDHTPGPWRVVDMGEYRVDCDASMSEAVGIGVRDGFPLAISVARNWLGRADANAKLIAAAPALLAALEGVVRVADRQTIEFDAARAAIAAARGDETTSPNPTIS